VNSSKAPGGRSPRARRGLAALAGLVAAALTLGVAELASALLGTASSPLLAIGSAVVDRVPLWLKDFAIRTFGSNDKAVLLATLGVAVALLAALAGVLELLRRFAGVALVVVLGLVTVAATATRAGAGTLDVLPSLLGFGLGALALRVMADRLRADAAPSSLPATTASGRRSFLTLAAATAGLAVVTGVAGRIVGSAARSVSAARDAVRLPRPAVPAPPLPAGASAPVEGMPAFVTANADFYRVDTALSVPRVDPATWTLRVHGLVEEEVEITYDELLDDDLVESAITLTCVSNEVGGELAGNAVWLGLPLHALLERARPLADADMVLSTSADGYTASTPLASLTDAGVGALLAVGMNGEPLPVEHGFPVRMVVPGLYGFVSATKWVVDLEVTRFADSTAYWTTRGYSAQAPIKTASRIDVPGAFAKVAPGRVAVGGTAWAQTRGITGVEVRVDDGPWRPATLADDAGLATWRQWSFAWEDATPGSHTLVVRATDATGDVQTADRARPAPDGATGWHSVTVTVA